MKLIPADQATGTDKASTYVRHYAPLPNLTTSLWLLDTGAHQFPVSVNTGKEAPGNTYVVSPQTAFIDYAIEETQRLQKRWLSIPLIFLIKGLGILLRSMQIDNLVQVNNWLLSTNLFPPDWQGEDIPAITQTIRTQFPDAGIVFRSLNAASNALLLQRFKQAGYLAIPSRQVYLFDGHDTSKDSFISRHNYQLDRALLKHSAYEMVQGEALQERDFVRIAELYQLLYLEKYSRFNPHYSAQWLHNGHRDGWMEFCVLRRKQRIDGVVGWFSNAEIITAPIVGYDIHLPQKRGLYRQLTHLCLQRTAAQQKILNFSSGAAHFKRIRGGKACIEYSMVYVAHLSLYRRMIWTLLSYVLHKIAVPLMQKYKL